MKYATLLTTAGILWLVGCESNSAITANLTAPLTAYATEIREIAGATYQSPPEMGTYSKLYLGKTKDYYNSKILLKINRYSAALVAMESLLDSAVTIDSVQLVLQSPDTVVNSDQTLDLFYFPDEGDSVFSENKTNYLNVISSQGTIIASSALYQSPPDSTEPVHPVLNFSVPVEVLRALADTSESSTSKNRTFCIQPQDSLSDLLTFYSRESSVDPRLEVYYTLVVNDSTVDTLVQRFYPNQDLSIVNPPPAGAADFASITVGRAAGFKTVLKVDSIVQRIPATALIKKARLTLFVKDTITTLSKLIVYPLDQEYWPIDSLPTVDDYQILSEYLVYANADSVHKVVIDLKRLVQDYVLDNVGNFGLKLISNNNSPFTTRTYYGVEGTATDPYLEVEYVAP